MLLSEEFGQNLWKLHKSGSKVGYNLVEQKESNTKICFFMQIGHFGMELLSFEVAFPWCNAVPDKRTTL